MNNQKTSVRVFREWKRIENTVFALKILILNINFLVLTPFDQ